MPDNQTLQWTGPALSILVNIKSVGAVPAIERWSVMQHEATTPPMLQYGSAPRSRRWWVAAFLIAGSFAQFALLLTLSFHRDVRWVDRMAWVLECPLFRIMWALKLPVTNSNGYALGLLNGLCWSSCVAVLVWLVRRARRAA